MQSITWIATHWKEIAETIAALVTVASAIVRWTPTLKDDSIWLPIVKFLGKYIALNRSTNDSAIRAGTDPGLLPPPPDFQTRPIGGDGQPPAPVDPPPAGGPIEDVTGSDPVT